MKKQRRADPLILNTTQIEALRLLASLPWCFGDGGRSKNGKSIRFSTGDVLVAKGLAKDGGLRTRSLIHVVRKARDGHSVATLVGTYEITAAGRARLAGIDT